MQQQYDPSPAALKALTGTYWSAQGWRLPSVPPPPAELAAAIAAGVMFPTIPKRSHDELVGEVRDLAKSVPIADAGQAFVASLSSHRLDLRSALGSLAVARHLPAHTFQEHERERFCAVCGLYPTSSTDPNVMNFERFKWGGVRRDHLDYIAFDLEQFLRAPRLTPVAADLDLGRTLLRTLRATPAEVTAVKAEAQLKLPKSNKSQRRNLLDILGVCGVLETAGHRGYADNWVDYCDREQPSRAYVESTYPVSWWTGADGVNERNARLFLSALEGS
ncbi:hypothetical protein OHA70_13525 [Kribbella sp. NBC_00382]|uniref:hypothetical protein n=1 Tax=Kribbella sp. NBC_00382 TaxID=2975967 RepID=UPI002E2260F6